jgi:hypothetical protein
MLNYNVLKWLLDYSAASDDWAQWVMKIALARADWPNAAKVFEVDLEKCYPPVQARPRVNRDVYVGFDDLFHKRWVPPLSSVSTPFRSCRW